MAGPEPSILHVSFLAIRTDLAAARIGISTSWATKVATGLRGRVILVGIDASRIVVRDLRRHQRQLTVRLKVPALSDGFRRWPLRVGALCGWLRRSGRLCIGFGADLPIDQDPIFGVVEAPGLFVTQSREAIRRQLHSLCPKDGQVE